MAQQCLTRQGIKILRFVGLQRPNLPQTSSILLVRVIKEISVLKRSQRPIERNSQLFPIYGTYTSKLRKVIV